MSRRTTKQRRADRRRVIQISRREFLNRVFESIGVRTGEDLVFADEICRENRFLAWIRKNNSNAGPA